MITANKDQTTTMFPINFFCCNNPNHFIEGETNRYQFCRSCHWFFKADLFIRDERAIEWLQNEIQKKQKQ
jgi:hypothetical protein